MPTLTIRNLPPEVYDRLRDRARRHRRSIAQEAAAIIEQAVGKAAAPRGIWRQVYRLREQIRSRYGTFPDSAPLTREDRER